MEPLYAQGMTNHTVLYSYNAWPLGNYNYYIESMSCMLMKHAPSLDNVRNKASSLVHLSNVQDKSHIIGSMKKCIGTLDNLMHGNNGWCALS